MGWAKDAAKSHSEWNVIFFWAATALRSSTRARPISGVGTNVTIAYFMPTFFLATALMMGLADCVAKKPHIAIRGGGPVDGG